MKNEKSILRRGIEAISKNKDFDWTQDPLTNAGASRFIEAGMEDRLGKAIPLPPSTRAVLTAEPSLYGSTPYLKIASPENVSVLVQAGALFDENMPFGTTTIPNPAGTSAQWAAEGVLVDDGAMSLSGISVKDLGCSANIDVENRVIDSGGQPALQLILDILIKAVWSNVESTILGKAAATAYSPKGAFYGLTKPTVSVDTDHLLLLEEEINGTKTPEGKYCYFTNQRGSTILKRTSGSIGLATRPLYDQGKVSEYPLFVTNSVASGVGSDSAGEGLLFARISDLFIGMCGGYLLLIDPYTLSKKAVSRITVQAFFKITGMRATSTDPYSNTFACLPMRY